MTLERADFSKFNILVIDDSKFVRQLVEAILGSFGVGNVCSAESVDDALRRMDNFHPDIVICDWQMYPVDGLTFLRKLRQEFSSRYARLPFIMLTGHSGADDVAKVLGEGANSYIVKPFSAQTLMKHILKVVASDSGQAASREVWAL